MIDSKVRSACCAEKWRKGAQDRRWNPTLSLEALVDADLDTLATALYARTDDLLKRYPERVPFRPKVGIAPQISDAELVTMAVMQALLGFTSEARWLRHARVHLRHLFPYLPQQPGYNKRLRRLAGTLNWLIGMLTRDTSIWTDDVWGRRRDHPAPPCAGAQEGHRAGQDDHDRHPRRAESGRGPTSDPGPHRRATDPDHEQGHGSYQARRCQPAPDRGSQHDSEASRHQAGLMTRRWRQQDVDNAIRC